jgi:hypothetical protein
LFRPPPDRFVKVAVYGKRFPYPTAVDVRYAEGNLGPVRPRCRVAEGNLGPVGPRCVVAVFGGLEIPAHKIFLICMVISYRLYAKINSDGPDEILWPWIPLTALEKGYMLK